MEDKKINYKKYGVIALLVALVLIGGTYAALNFDVLIGGNKENKISSCKLSFNFSDANPISLVSTAPIDDSLVSSFAPYTFTITNNSSCDTAYYKITLADICNTCTKTDDKCTVNGEELVCTDSYKIDSSKIKYQLTNKSNSDVITNTNPLAIDYKGSIAKGASASFELKIWIDKSTSNSDLYVFENGSPKLNADGSIVTKNVGYKVNVEGQDSSF